VCAVQSKQNLTVRLDRETIRKAKILAAKRGTSISELVSKAIIERVAEGEAFEAAERRAVVFLDQGFHLGGRMGARRDDLHDRAGLRRHERPRLRARP